MRGSDERTGELFSYVDLEKRIPGKHPLRPVRRVVNEVLAALDGDFSKAYAEGGRPSIAPERLLRALLLQAFYTIRSERQLMEQIDYNLLYRWFVGLGVDEPVWVPTVFTKNRDRLLEADVARRFLAELMDHKELRGLLSDEHFSVDGTQIAAWASMKSFKAKDGSSEPPGAGRNGERDFHGEKPSNATHASTTDPEAQLYRKGHGKEAKLSFMGHVLMENRSGLIVATTLTKATGTAEREAAEEMIVRHSPGARRITLGADKGYDAASFVADMRALNVTRREFIARVGAAAAGAVCQSGLTYAQAIAGVAHRMVEANGIHLHFVEQGEGPWSSCATAFQSRGTRGGISFPRCRRPDSMLSRLTCAAMVSPTDRRRSTNTPCCISSAIWWDSLMRSALSRR